MTRVSEATGGSRACPATGLGYPLASVLVGVARDEDGHTTGRDEDRAR
jgi:hypothetical protein